MPMIRESFAIGKGGILPSHGSGSFLAARSSIENLMSLPFSILDSGSAFMSQYCRLVGDGGCASSLDFDVVLSFCYESVFGLIRDMRNLAAQWLKGITGRLLVP